MTFVDCFLLWSFLVLLCVGNYIFGHLQGEKHARREYEEAWHRVQVEALKQKRSREG